MPAPTPFVLDNSVLCGWILAAKATPYSEAVARLLPLADAHAPWLLQLEFTNVLRTACRRGSLPAAKALTTRSSSTAEPGPAPPAADRHPR